MPVVLLSLAGGFLPSTLISAGDGNVKLLCVSLYLMRLLSFLIINVSPSAWTSNNDIKGLCGNYQGKVQSGMSAV